jgi:hypothetical protein
MDESSNLELFQTNKFWQNICSTHENSSFIYEFSQCHTNQTTKKRKQPSPFRFLQYQKLKTIIKA